MLSYLTTAAPQLGPLAWIFFIGQILGVAGGAYLYFMHTERNPARQTFVRQLGIALMILGGVGVVMGALRMLNVPVLNQPLWFWIQAVIELGIAGYAIYYTRTVLPALERNARSAKPSARSARAFPNGDPAPATPRPVATTGRREARRERKRRK